MRPIVDTVVEALFFVVSPMRTTGFGDHSKGHGQVGVLQLSFNFWRLVRVSRSEALGRVRAWLVRTTRHSPGFSEMSPPILQPGKTLTIRI